jgi:hypothetical protein
VAPFMVGVVLSIVTFALASFLIADRHDDDDPPSDEGDAPDDTGAVVEPETAPPPVRTDTPSPR